MLFSTKSIAHGLPRDNITHSITYKAGDPKPTKSGAEPIHILLNQADKNRCFFFPLPIPFHYSFFLYLFSSLLLISHCGGQSIVFCPSTTTRSKALFCGQQAFSSCNGARNPSFHQISKKDTGFCPWWHSG